MVYSNNFGQTRVGIRNVVVTQVVNAVDADATAFIAAAGITNLTQAAAISTLVNDLKAYGLWTKMKALYPMVGGSATSHKFNLKDPRDLDVAFRLVFNGGWIHSSTGALPNGLNTFADTKLTPSSTFNTTTLNHLSYYSRTSTGSQGYSYDMGSYDFNNGGGNAMIIRRSTNVSDFTATYPSNISYSNVSTTVTDGSGLFIGTQNGSSIKYFRNTSLLATNTTAATNATAQPVYSPIFIGTLGEYGYATTNRWSNKECTFASIGTSLTDTETTNFYTSVQKFQTTLGRQIGSPIVSDTDAQAFLNAAGITDLGQANAVNTLVVDLKAAGVWTKMKALYPFVGGTATSHKFNLKDPRDLNAAFRLTFNGGWTHTATGALPNGTTGYADTNLIPSSVMTNYNSHMSFYSRTQSLNSGVDIGSHQSANYFLQVYTAGFGGGTRSSLQRNDYDFAFYQSSSTIGHFMGQILSQSNSKIYTNGVLRNTNTTNNAISLPSINIYIGSLNINGFAGNFTNRESAFASIGDSLTDAEAAAFYTAVQKYQTSLSRQIGTPVLASGQTAGLLETYSGAAAAYSLRKLRNGYVGNAIRVRRSSDNAEQDIAFNTSGGLDTVSLLAFVGNGNGFVTTWYDQSGNGLHFTQSTASNQPSIVINSTLVLTFGEPSVRFNSVNKNYLEIPSSTSSFNFLHNGTDSTVISVGRYNFVTDPGTESTLISNGGAGSATVGTWIGFSDITPYNNVFGAYISRGVAGIGNNATHTAVSMVNDTALPYTKQNLHFVNINAGAAAIDRIKVQYDNNTIAKNNILSNSPSTANATNNMMMGVYIQSGVKYSALEGDVQELIIYNSNQDTNRIGIKTNINSYYSIY